MDANTYYDSATNTIFLGDGEYLSGTIFVNEENEPYSNVNITEVEFVPVKSAIQDKVGTYVKDACVQSDRVTGISPDSGHNSHPFQLYHTHDYSVYGYKKTASAEWTYVTGGIENMYRLSSEGDRTTEVRNETVKETSYVGYLQISYSNYAKGSGSTDATYKIPVYVQVRNNPCADDGDYYKKYVE